MTFWLPSSSFQPQAANEHTQFNPEQAVNFLKASLLTCYLHRIPFEISHQKSVSSTLATDE